LVPDVIEDIRNEKTRNYLSFEEFSGICSIPLFVMTHKLLPDSHLDSRYASDSFLNEECRRILGLFSNFKIVPEGTKRLMPTLSADHLRPAGLVKYSSR
jgi:hypothetical protein